MKPIDAVRLLWSMCIALFASGIVGLKWGAQLSTAFMPASQRPFSDADLLHAIWIKRSIFLLLLSALCGVLGIYLSLRASERQQ